MPIFLFLFLIPFFSAITYGQDEPLRIDFSRETAEENGVTIQGPGFGAYPLGKIQFGEIPLSHTFYGSTDGRGAIVTAQPGEGVMILGEVIHTPNAAAIRCTVRAEGPSASVTLAAIDAGKNQFVSTTSPNQGTFFQGAYRRISSFFVPPSTGFRPLIQVLNTSDDQTLTVYIDNFDVYLLDADRYYHAQFLDGDENDPGVIGIPVHSGQPTEGSSAAIALQPACANLNIDGTLRLSSEYTINGPGALHWRTETASIANVDGSGTVRGTAAGHAHILAQIGGRLGRALIFVNPIPALHNDRPYEWYQTQMGTGDASYNNCGPTSTHMAMRWYNGTDIPVEELRNRYPHENGWWYTYDVTQTLDNYEIPYAIQIIRNSEDIIACLERGHIVILCAEMKWITYNKQPFYDRFYTFDSGHFLIVKGYSLDGKYLVVYDPNAWGNDYGVEGVMLGRNRLYRSEEVFSAIKTWWPFAIEVGASPPPNTVQTARIPTAKAGPRITELEMKER